MTQILLLALLALGSNAAGAEAECTRVRRVLLPVTEPNLKITSRKGPWFGHLIGRSKDYVRKCQGEPTNESPDEWRYVEPLGPGAHSFRHSWVVKFERDRVAAVEVTREAVGCILIPPPRDWLRN